MLRGEEGRQRKELDKLVDWLARDVRPDVVHLYNVHAGRHGPAARAAGSACRWCATLSGEDIFVEKLPEPHYGQARAVLRERAAIWPPWSP